MNETNAQPPNQPAPQPVGDPRLTPENLRQLTEARTALKKIRRAVSVARFDGWTVAILGMLTLIFGFSSFWGLAIGTAMVVIAFVELRSADRLSKLDSTAIKVMALNQVCFASLLIIYAAWSILNADNSSIVGDSDWAELGYSPSQVAHIAKLLTLVIYGGVILLALFAQGGLALYYTRKRKHLDKYLARTPEWITAMQKQGISV
jgi:hypothetical protein